MSWRGMSRTAALLPLILLPFAESIECDDTDPDVAQHCPTGMSWFDAVPPPCCEVVPCYILFPVSNTTCPQSAIFFCDLKCEATAAWLILALRRPDQSTFNCDVSSVSDGSQRVDRYNVQELVPAYESCCTSLGQGTSQPGPKMARHLTPAIPAIDGHAQCGFDFTMCRRIDGRTLGPWGGHWGSPGTGSPMIGGSLVRGASRTSMRS